MGKWSKTIQQYLYFNRFERKGLLLLSSLLVALMIFRLFLVDIVFRPPQPDYHTLEQFLPQLRQIDSTANQEVAPSVENKLFAFDPNTCSKEVLLQLGFPERTANTLLNFRSKGGFFRKKEDLKRVYGLSPALYQRIENYIALPEIQASKEYPEIPTVLASTAVEAAPIKTPVDPNEANLEALEQIGLPSRTARILIKFREKGARFYASEDLLQVYGMTEELLLQLEPWLQFAEKPPQAKRPAVEKKNILPIDINKASTEEWQSLPGIGPAYAKRIVTFREKLGGFYGIEQISETWGLPDSTFQAIQSWLQVSPVHKKLLINQLDIKTLSEHPYLDYQQASLIVRFRENHGPFQSVEDLRKIPLLKETDLQRLFPYLDFSA